MDERIAHVAMDRAAFYAWGEGRPGKYERILGVPVRMAPEQLRHVIVKGQLYAAMDRAVEATELSCAVYGSGLTIEIDADTDYVPDMTVTESSLPLDDMGTACPLIVAEVLSPSTEANDTGPKLAGYFSLPSLAHYLIVSPRQRHIVHHWRDGGRVASRIITTGTIDCDPPGLSVTLDDIYERVL